MWELSKIDRILGALVGAVLGATAGALLVLGGENLVPGPTDWFWWGVTVGPGAIGGSLCGFVGGVKSIFNYR
jgi:hypothetical protein